MIPIFEVVKDVFRIGPLETGGRTPASTPYLIVGQQQALIWEPGELGQVPALLEAIKEIGVDRDRIAYISPSHIHLHHIQGVPVLLKEIPQATFMVHQRAVPHLIDPTRLNQSTAEMWGEGCPQIDPVPADRIWGVAGGEVIDLGERELDIIDAPGHTFHMIALFDRLTRALFPGDSTAELHLNRERGNDEIRPPLFHVDKYVDTLHRFRALKPSVVFTFGFGGVSHSPEKMMQWAEEDVRVVERICREGMKQKMNSDEIGKQVAEYYEQVGIPHNEPVVFGQYWLPYGMCAHIHKQDPSLEMPQRPPGRPMSY